MDLFVALTNDDENNIMSSLLAKRLGARRVIALINRSSYGDLMQGGQIDIAISPAQVTIGTLLRMCRRGDVRGGAFASPRRGRSAGAGGARRRSKPRSVIGKTIEQIELPRGRHDRRRFVPAAERTTGESAQVIMAHHDIAIQAEDHLIVFVENKRMIPRGREAVLSSAAGFF